MNEVIFLIVLGVVWIIFAVFQDLRTREIANWLNFSLIIFALGFRFFHSVFSNDFNFFYQGLYGLGIFFILGNLLYYGRLFAGGDAKLMIALGTVLPFKESFFENLDFLFLFLMVFLFIGVLYTLIITLIFSLRNFKMFKREYYRELKKHRIYYYFGLIFSILLVVLGFVSEVFFAFGILVFVFLNLYIYAKSVDESSMVKKVKTSSLAEGDWLYRNVKVGRKTIKASWEGLRESEIKLLKKKHRSVMIRQGIPFSPVFLISFLFVVWFFANNLRNPFW